MPKMVSEIAQGQSYEFSASEAEVAARTTRVFRVIKNSPGEYLNVFQACGVYVGDLHPREAGLYCESVSAQYDGDSRLSILVTFNYVASLQFEQSSGGGGGGGRSDRLSKPPDLRPANWSIGTSLVEVPAFSWRRILPVKAATPDGGWKAIINPVGDLYDGVSKTEGIITINVEQWEEVDPTKNCEYTGYINSKQIKLGGLTMEPHTLMFRGVQTQPSVEQYNDKVYKGWKATYEFLYRKNTAQISDDTGELVEIDIGWDRAQPQSGFNIRNLSPVAEESFSVSVCEDADPPIEAGAFLLKHESQRIKGWPNALEFADGTSNRKARGMILVMEYEDGGASQRPSAQPIPLNDDGTPRWSGADSPVLVYRYQVQPEIDLFNKLTIRLAS